ncbi:MAG: helix-turn-helix domain-containing protein [Burkholderiaceae bacterium]|jgi:AraC-like DNA-binding protein
MPTIDRLTPVLDRFPPTARVFFSNVLCNRFTAEAGDKGHIHWLRNGAAEVWEGDRPMGVLSEPGVVFSPGGSPHSLIPQPRAEMVCAEFEFGQRFRNPLTLMQPGVVVIPISRAPEIATVHTLLIDEAFSHRCGKDYGVNQLLQYFILIVFRYLIRTESIPTGITKALADDRLLKAINAMHAEPAKAWTLEALAAVAGMSRASFAHHFREATHTTPGEYLADWRISLAQSKIASGVPLKGIAREVGYASPEALTRAFTKRIGASPRAWLASQKTSSP